MSSLMYPIFMDIITKEKITNSPELIDYLLDEANVAAVPGAAFGSNSRIRLSYATFLEDI